MRRANAVIAILFAIVFHSGHAQELPSVTVAPPQIAFDDWKSVAGDDEDVDEFATQFPSAIATASPENNTVQIRAFLPKRRSGPVPVVVVLHYWGASDQKIERSLAGDLARRGVGSVLMTLPYHLGRTPAGVRSGELAIEPDPARLTATMTQAVFDVRRTVDFINGRPEFDSARIGIAGTSLGSIVSELAFAVEPRFQHAAFMLGGADLAHILWHSSRVVKVRDELRKKGLTEPKLRDALRTVEPLEYLGARKEGNSFVIGGKFDTVVPPADTQKLIAALPSPKTLMLDTGHYGGIFVERRILRLVSEYFGKEFGGTDFTPPKHVYAPSVRIVVQANNDSGVQLGVGLDLWKSSPRSELFSTIIATPRGPQLFLGTKIDRSLAVGAFATTRRVSAGVMWSIVL